VKKGGSHGKEEEKQSSLGGHGVDANKAPIGFKQSSMRILFE
jgi:hypothetical protein